MLNSLLYVNVQKNENSQISIYLPSLAAEMKLIFVWLQDVMIISDSED